MANAEQLEILEQGVEAWNKWREESPYIPVDLGRADLSETDLRSADLSEADLTEADLRDADLSGADLTEADLRDADLSGANLRESRLSKAALSQAHLDSADLSSADLSGADLFDNYLNDANLTNAKLDSADLGQSGLRGANLSKANLNNANLSGATLADANLSGGNLMNANLRSTDLTDATLGQAYLYGANLNSAFLKGTDFSYAEIHHTILGHSDLRKAIGLEEIIHRGPSYISTDTFALSKGNIPEVFLRGCGLSDWEIEAVKLYNPDLSNHEISDIQYRMYDLRATQALQISPLFISYSHADRTFVDKLERYLNKNGVRFWRDIHDMKAGRMEKQVDRAIRLNPTVLLVLSEQSLSSDWVQHEVREARDLEKQLVRDVLCPVALDDSWKSSTWEKHLMEQVMKYNVLDFSEWQDDSKFDGIFRRLIDGLELFYKG